jgi:PLP dependent protein
MEKERLIERNVKEILAELPAGVELVAAAKTRTADEIMEAIGAGVKTIGENYLQEAEEVFGVIGKKALWHFIGHLQKNKVKKAVEIFDMIETVDSYGLAEDIDRRCANISRVMPILIEVNSGKEKQKSGVLPEDAIDLIKGISVFKNIKILGLMTMGPRFGNPEDARPYFVETKRLFEEMKKAGIEGVEMRYLSMGMTNSYRIAIEEGANIVRIGSKIFGEREEH